MDSELDKPSKHKSGLTRRLMARCHHCPGLGRRGECPNQPVSKGKKKNSESEACGEREVRGETEVH